MHYVHNNVCTVYCMASEFIATSFCVYQQFLVLLDALAKLRTATVMSTPPTVCQYETPRLRLVGFHTILYLRIFAKICRENLSFIEI
jgi:hypothetical protein